MSTPYPLEPRSAAAAQVRATLQDREARLRAEVEATRARGEGDPTRVAREATDRGEDAESQVELGLNDAEVARDVAELREIGEALARLDAGRYGLCKDCDEPIDERRLAAEPFAIRCTACQGRFELARSRRA
ncbi:TraR/DksA family transcriptional regulator [Piscinibacter aquaticus]|uniref:TraR/DksA family transcriptional regulator n=1 Tax=Piscinibacter aquaticus TaxID=392597 RepID=A0A5C6U0Z4_9BURK|nr:TraR/DksA family transcriptional regulator [Piscinibacter aquaticus]